MRLNGRARATRRHARFVRNDTCPLAITGGTGIYRNARGDGTIQIVPNVPNDTDANFVLNVTG